MLNSANDIADYISVLNTTQQTIVQRTQGAILVLAGAGTGKTKTLTTRVAHILKNGLAKPDEILCVTFTNKAANEMRERIEALIGTNINYMPWLGTFHGLGAKFLRKHAELAGLTSDFTIIDKNEAGKVIKKLISEEQIEDPGVIIKNIAHNIELWKGRAIQPEKVNKSDYETFHSEYNSEYNKDHNTSSDAKFLTAHYTIAIYNLYQKELKKMGVCDFGDLLMYPVYILQNNSETLKHYQQKLRYILVDEYQDTNLAQYLWLRLLAQKEDTALINICCVGDDDQSIYGWRGAKVEHMLRFTSDFPGAQTIRLERNYRSAPHILNTANGLIGKNMQRLGKILYPDKTNRVGAKIYHYKAPNHFDEAEMIGSIITTLQNQGQKLNSIAILVRSRALLRAFDSYLMNARIACHVIGDSNLYSKIEVKDLLAYLRLVAQPSNNLAFERIINLPRRGVGKVAMQKIEEYAAKQEVSLFTSLTHLIDQKIFAKKLHHSLSEFVANFNQWHAMLEHSSIDYLAQYILKESRYQTMLETSGAEGQEKLTTLRDLINSMSAYNNLNEYLEHIALATERAENTNIDAVNLMTIHASKGLEFNTVLLPGWEEGLFPPNRRDDIEEERRLAYVAITRAKNDIYISHAKFRYLYGRSAATNGPSRFIDELPVELLQNVTYNSFTSSKPRHKLATVPCHNFRINERVGNEKLGSGTVIAIEQEKLTISFDSGEVRLVMASFVTRL